jgi:hypothetical protein
MLHEIKSAEQAESILRGLIGSHESNEPTVFDLDASLDFRNIPLVIRKCCSCGNPGEYIGWNISGEGFYKPAIYCCNCGFAMNTLASADIVMQGDKVIYTYNR